MSGGFSLSLHRAVLIGRQTLRGLMRQRIANALVFLGAVLVGGARLLGDFNFGVSPLKFVADFGFGTIGLLGSGLAIALVAHAYFSEIEQRTVLTLLAKPVRHGEFIAGKFGAAVLVLAAYCALLTGLLAAVLWTQTLATDAVVNYAAVALTGYAHALKCAVLAALTLLLCTLSRSQLLAIALSLAALLICHLQHVAQEVAHRTDSWATKAGASALALLFPNFQVFNFEEKFSAGVALGGGEIVAVTLYAAGYCIVAGALATWSFRQREF
ncbi:MAG: ABC transporter permease [Opitutus sp.]|nr:ABC transporter permease [Opitutus sp.]